MKSNLTNSIRRHVRQALLEELNISIPELERKCGRKLDKRLCRRISLWLNKRNPRFAGRTPTEVARNSGRDRVLYELCNLITGMDRVIEKVLRPMLMAPGTEYFEFMTQCRQCRRKAGMTIGKLAAKAHVSIALIKRIEKRDTRWVRFSQLQRLAAAVNWRPPFRPQSTPLAPAKKDGGGKEDHRGDH